MTRRQQGFALTELLVVMSVGLVLLGAVLTTFNGVLRKTDETDKRNDSAELARRSLDIQARQLRNLAQRVDNVPVLSTVAEDDLVFQTSDPTRTWVRYCLDTSPGTDRGVIWQQQQSANTPGSTTSCGPSATGWQKSVVVADNVVNRIDGRAQPLFKYRCVGGGTACVEANSWDQIIGIDATVDVDTTPRRDPPELEVTSGVYLRNQNQAPVAVMSHSNVSGQPRTIQLNASGSSDYEGRTLQYYWFLGTMPNAIKCSDAKETVVGSTVKMWGGDFIGSGVVLQYQWKTPTPASGTQQSIGLVACDPGYRFSYSGPNQVPIP